MVNVGETDEPRIIEKLISLRGRSVIPFGTIESVADFRGREYPADTPRSRILKAPTFAKRDIIVNQEGYSLKSTRAARPAIVNHTTREKWVRVCEKIGVHIDMLDIMVSEYWQLREQYRIGEDVATNNNLCPFGNTQERRLYLKDLINYFLFDGTGSKDSPYPADYILEFTDPLDPTVWKILDRNSAFDFMWPKIVFSIRSKKGMPPDYPRMSDVRKKALIKPWVRYIDEDYRGALHIRAG